MLPKTILDRITGLMLNPRDHAAVCQIVSEAMVVAATKKGTAVAKTIPPDWPADYREQFWKLYPNRKAKAHAMKALDKVAFAGKTAWHDLLAGLDRYIKSKTVKRGFVAHPATWLNAERWKDEDGPGDAPGGPSGTNGGGPGFFEIAAGR
jgi:hypothetical protein